MKAIHASYLVAIALVTLAGSMGNASAQGDGSSEEFLIETQLNPAPSAMHYLSDNSLPGNRKIDRQPNERAGARPSHGRGGPGCGHRPPGPDPEFLKSLGLTDEQREKLHSIREKEHLSSASRISELIKLRHQLFELITAAGKAEEGDALAIQKQINNLDNANQIDRVASMLEAKAVFTDEQSKQLRRHMLEHEPFGGPMGGPACGPGPMGPHGRGGPMGG
ncbi:hypothetical protein BH11CYA1_BH11CYA1_38140 [soil metagenome]